MRQYPLVAGFLRIKKPKIGWHQLEYSARLWNPDPIRSLKFFFLNDNSVKKNSVSAKSNKIVLILIFKNEFVGIGF